jgi:hypothetical protein
MKKLSLLLLLSLPLMVNGQSIVGKWQLIKSSSCVGGDMDDDELVTEMKNMASPGNQVVTFKDNNAAEESTRIISRKKSYNSRAMLYKFSGESLFILDKRSKTIIESFNVEQLSADSLIISNSSRACETKVFVKIK